jgi:hypothetical protein
LDLILFVELVPVLVHLLVSSDDISNSGRTEEVLLLKSEFLTSLCAVIRVQDTGNVFSLLPFFNGTMVITSIELLEVELIAGP